MLRHGQTLADLQQRFYHHGSVEWLGIRPAPRVELHGVEQMELLEGRGPSGDHRANRSGGNRQVTLIQFEHLAVIAALLQRPALELGALRRNVVIRGINLLALRTARFRLGTALLEGSGYCHPCSRMEEILGPGGYSAVRGHGGITAKVLQGGLVSLGDPVVFAGSVRTVRDP